MSYYILPKNNNIIIVDPSNGVNSIEPIISLTIKSYYYQLEKIYFFYLEKKKVSFYLHNFRRK
jgi:hypothetical protein